MTDIPPAPAARLLDPLTFPLHRRRLIEASAGTGKTYTITALYLRLLLGDGDSQSAREAALRVDQILVVTFTEAATEELRDRIRSRIQDAWRALKGESTGDPFLQALIDRQPDHERAAQLLEIAARQMDEAAIFTIHGFCQRMLKQHAFESGSLFETELITDDSVLLRQAVLDIWRAMIYPRNDALGRAIQEVWASPDRLQAELRPLMGRPELNLLPALATDDLESRWSQWQQWLAQFRQQWLASDTDLAELIQGSGVNKNSYRKSSVPKWLAAITAFASGELEQPPEDSIAKLAQSQLAAKTPAGKAVPEHPLFELCEQFVEQRLPLRELLLTRARQEIEARFEKLKRDARQLSFDDLLRQLDQALMQSQDGHLAGAISQQYPVAMIDEFQDTDALQYRIFTTLYSDTPAHGLFMIGDPKQAIYGFRGADIFTYIRARRQVTDHYTLATNWRSSSAMIGAVNGLFEQAERPFIYDDDIPFIAVQPSSKADDRPFTLHGQQPAALQFWFDGQPFVSKGDYLQQMADGCAADIQAKLQAGAEGNALLGEAPLCAGDLAVLVRNRQEAAAVRDALALRQIPSVYLSGRDSVFSSQEAFDLKLLLQAVAEPQDERRLRAALATALLNYPARYLDQLATDEQLWEGLVAEFSDYQQTWERLGVLPMLRRLMRRRQLAESLQQQGQGERRLTDLLHLGEILQKASLEQDSNAALLRWYSDQLQRPNGESDEQRIRLESDSRLVSIITVHKSKGLEYPLVYLPFGCSYTRAREPLYHDQDDLLCFDLAGNDAALEAADRERLAEDLRLLYVALTRSVHACFIGLANLPDGQSRSKSGLHRSALGYLLLNGGRDSEALDDALKKLSASARVQVTAPPEPQRQAGLFDVPENPPEPGVARTFQRQLRRDWRISSYSGLVSHGHHDPVLPGLDLEVIDEQADSEPLLEPNHDIFSFPKGAQAGTFLHELFEQIDFTDYRGVAAELISQRCTLAGYDEVWQPVLRTLLDNVLQTVLNPGAMDEIRLDQIGSEARLVEMEFVMPARGLHAGRLNQLLRDHDPLTRQTGELSFETLQGMLKGFIDLVFVYRGRYYILDYKSNHLGMKHSDYDAPALQQAMLEHRYDFQYQLYALALHRLLASRLPDYDYERHFGGVFYLFLRGMSPDQPGNGVFHCRPQKALVDGLDQLFRGDA